MDFSQMSDSDLTALASGKQPQAAMPDFSSMSDDDLQKLAGAKSSPNQAVIPDVAKTIAGNVVPTAAANYAANLASPLYTAGSYALQLGMKGGEYAGEGIDELRRLATGQPQATQADYDQQSKDLMNAIRGKMGLQPSETGDISQLVPTPSNLVGGAAKALGTPLYQPKTEAGRQTESLGNITSAGLGAGFKAVPAAMGAVGGTELPEIGKQAGATPAEQYLLGLGGGLGGAKIGASPLEASPMSDAEEASANTILTPEPGISIHTSDSLRALAQKAYANSKDLGATFSQEASEQLPKNIEKDMLTTGKMNDRLHGDTMSVLDDMKNDATSGTLSLEDIHQYRQLFGDVINNNLHPNGKMKPDAMKANQAINTIDDFLDNAKKNPDQMVSGSPEAIQAWQQGQDLWSASNRVNDIERIMQRAELMQNSQRHTEKKGRREG